MRINSLSISLICFVFVALLGTAPSKANQGVILTTDQTSITFNKYEEKQIKIFFSPFTGSSSLCISDKGEAFSGQYKLAKELGTNDNFYLFSIKPREPVKNGDFQLSVRHCESTFELTLNLSVNIDLKEAGLYLVQFEMDCPNPFLGKKLKCTISPQITGSNRNSVQGRYKVSFFSRAKGVSKWDAEDEFTWKIEDGVVFSFFNLTKPTEIRSRVEFEGQSSEFEKSVYPKPQLKVLTPGAVTVGDTFLLKISTSKTFSATCLINNRTKVKVSNGFGQIKLYGPQPGKLDLTVSCSAPNWGDSWAYKYVWVRN